MTSEKEFLATIKRQNSKINELQVKINHLNKELREKDKEIKKRELVFAEMTSGQFKQELLHKLGSVSEYVKQTFNGGTGLKQQ